MSSAIGNAANEASTFLYGTESDPTWLGALLRGADEWINDPTGVIAKTHDAKTKADQQATADDLAQQNLKHQNALAQTQEQARIDALAGRQATDLGLYHEQQALEEQKQTTAEQNAYTSANDQLRGAQEQLGANRAGVNKQASGIVAGAAARGIKVGNEAVQSAGDTGKGDITTNPDGSVSYSKPGANIYDSSSSPLAQLAAYETSANRSIANEAEGVVGASNLATGSIRSGTAEFEAQQAENLKGFATQQQQQMDSAHLDQSQLEARAHLEESIQASVFTQTESFTQTNLQTYDSSLWLAAFASVVSEGTSLLGSLWTPKVGSSYQSSDYTDWNQYAQFGQYRG